MTRVRLHGRALAHLPLLTVVACADAPADAVPTIVYDTIAGVEHVLSSGPGLWESEGVGWTLDETRVVVIGEMDGPEEYVFGQISGVVIDDERRIHVADPQAKEVRVFSSEGELIRRLGRDGEGPGEFRHISGLAVAPDGVAAMDPNLRRITVFGPSGEIVRMFRLERSYMILEHHAPMAFDSRGRFFDRARLTTMPGVDSIGVITYDADGARPDTAFLAEIRQDHVLLERNGVPYMSIPRPFAPQPSLAFGPEGTVYLARGDHYRVDVFSPTGDSLRAIVREVDPRPVTTVEADSALAFIAEAFESYGASLPPGTKLPERKPVIRRLVVDAAGNLWVLEEPESGSDRFEWAVHDPAGRYLGVVATPQMAVTQIGSDFLAGTMADELGVGRVVVYPLSKAGR